MLGGRRNWLTRRAWTQNSKVPLNWPPPKSCKPNRCFHPCCQLALIQIHGMNMGRTTRKKSHQIRAPRNGYASTQSSLPTATKLRKRRLALGGTCVTSINSRKVEQSVAHSSIGRKSFWLQCDMSRFRQCPIFWVDRSIVLNDSGRTFLFWTVSKRELKSTPHFEINEKSHPCPPYRAIQIQCGLLRLLEQALVFDFEAENWTCWQEIVFRQSLWRLQTLLAFLAVILVRLAQQFGLFQVVLPKSCSLTLWLLKDSKETPSG